LASFPSAKKKKKKEKKKWGNWLEERSQERAIDKKITDHFDNNGFVLFSIRLLVDGFEEERIFGKSLHGFDQDVHQSKAVAVALRLAPLNQRKAKSNKQLNLSILIYIICPANKLTAK
jgi:hypothetical protein